MDNKIIGIYDEYANGYLDRREFLERLVRLAGGTAAASTGE